MSELKEIQPKKSRNPIALMRALTQTITSQLVSRMQLSTLAGLSYGGKRDIYRVFGYDHVLNYQKYVARYMRNGLASRIVTAYPNATWRNAPRVFDIDVDERTSPFEKAWDALVDKFDLFSIFERVDILAGLGEYAIIFIGAPGTPGNALPNKLSIDKMLYLAPYGQGAALIQRVETNPSNERFGLPTFYKLGGVDLTHLNIAQPLPTVAIDTHYTRVFHVAEGLLEGMLFGKPRLENVWNYLDDMDKITGGSAETFWMTADRGMQFDVDKDVIIEDAAELDREIEEYVHGMSRVLKTQGVNAKELGTNVADPRGHFSTALSCISGTTGIPQRILIGSEAGQLASTQDRDNWNERVTERRTSYAEPNILRPFISKMIDIGVLPKPQGGKAQIEWPDLLAYSADQMSVQALRFGNAMNSYSNMVKNGSKLCTTSEFRKKFLGLPAQMPVEKNLGADETDLPAVPQPGSMQNQALPNGQQPNPTDDPIDKAGAADPQQSQAQRGGEGD